MELDQLLRQGIAAARAGQKAQACDLLLQVIALDEGVEAAWLWLSGVVDSPEERLICLENVLTLNPGNTAAQDGLRWLRDQGISAPAKQAPITVSKAPRPVPSPLPAEVIPPQSTSRAQPSPVPVEIDPYGCPYCGGSVSSEGPRCVHCGRLVTVRHRKRPWNAGLGWLAFFFFLLGVVSWLDGFLIVQMVRVGQLPAWMNQTYVRFLVGPALFSPEGIPGELADYANVVILVDYSLAGLCVVAALGLALRFRAVYFGSFLLAGLMVIAVGTGLLMGLTGWIPAILRLGLVALSVKWLVDNAPAFEWQTRSYNADTDQDLRTDMDYYSRGQEYRDMGMWAKAAAHWKVATQLAPSQAQYHVALANAYLRLRYPAAALTEADKALALTPEDGGLRAFRQSLAELEQEH
jgi:tetratricopeptide (TPR) repeat protein